MDSIHIVNDFLNKATPNFFIGEFWATKYGGYIDFDMKKCYADAVQFIRDYYCKKYNSDVPFEVTSVIRPNDADWSPHKTGDAVDSIPLVNVSAIMHDVAMEFKNWMNSELVKGLLSTGVNVLLIEAGCLHFANRDIKLNSHKATGYEYDLFYIGEWINDGSAYGKNICYA